MMDIIRDSAFGQTVRFVTKNKFFLYPEEKADFSWAPLVSINLVAMSQVYKILTWNPG